MRLLSAPGLIGVNHQGFTDAPIYEVFEPWTRRDVHQNAYRFHYRAQEVDGSFAPEPLRLRRRKRRRDWEM